MSLPVFAESGITQSNLTPLLAFSDAGPSCCFLSGVLGRLDNLITGAKFFSECYQLFSLLLCFENHPKMTSKTINNLKGQYC